MGRFDVDETVVGSGVTIVTSNATLFSVEWKDLIVRDAKHLGRFTFGVALSVNGDIIFVYEKVKREIIGASIAEGTAPFKN